MFTFAIAFPLGKRRGKDTFQCLMFDPTCTDVHVSAEKFGYDVAIGVKNWEKKY